MATGALTVIVWDYLPLVNGVTLYKATNLYSLVLGFALALIVNIIVSLIAKKPSKEIQDELIQSKALKSKIQKQVVAIKRQPVFC